MANATLSPVPTTTTRETTTSEFIAIVAAQSRPEYAPGRVNSGRQASFDAIAGWNARGGVD